MKVFVIKASLLLALSTMAVQAGDMNVKLGMWEWSMTMEMPGMPMAMPPTVYSACLTKDDLVPKQSEQKNQCKMLENNIKGNSVSWKMECRSEAGVSTSEGTMSYSGTTATGDITATAQGMVMKTKVSGRRTGPCQ